MSKTFQEQFTKEVMGKAAGLLLTGAAAVGIRGIMNLINKAKHQPGSYIKATQSMRVEPLCLIESILTNHEITPDLQQTLLSMFSGYYLQAVAMDNVVGNVKVAQTLNKLNPNGSDPIANDFASAWNSVLRTSTASGTWLGDTINNTKNNTPIYNAFTGNESLDEGPKLPDLAIGREINRFEVLQNVRKWEQGMVAALEAIDESTPEGKQKKEALQGIKVSDAIKEVKEAANLAVGKILNVEIQNGNNSITVPVAVRLHAASVPTGPLASIVAGGVFGLDGLERYHGYRSGALEFWKDIVLCKGMIKEHVKNAIQDKTGNYSAIHSQRAKRQGMFEKPTVATMSNIIVITDDTAKRIEAKMGYKLDRFKTREEIFEMTGLIFLVVVDTMRNRVLIYSQSIERPTVLTFNDLKRTGKKSDTNISDILAAFQMGQAPSF